MKWYILFLFIIGYLSMIEAACQPTIKFYINCGNQVTASTASQFCQAHQMTLVNLTNGTTLTHDIALLNTTFNQNNCTGYFWFSSGSQTGLAVAINSLGDLVTGLLTGVLNAVLCLIPFICPGTTTPSPITSAFTVCTRSTQQNVIQKCSQQVQRPDMQQFQFNEQSMPVGVLDTFPVRSLMTCSGLCSANATCVGISFNNGVCVLYM
jgi:hypothetical protein